VILVVGLSHRTAPIEVRERLASSAEALPEVLARLSARPELSEALFLSTCNRVEVFAAIRGEDCLCAARAAVREVLVQQGGAGGDDGVAEHLYERSGREAVRHIFRVAASLDSMVLGEPQILGQVKRAYEAASAAGTLGAVLGRCMTRAFSVAKRVRTETQIGTGTVSVSSVAVDLAARIFGDLAGHHVLLLGAGEMAEAAARSLGKGARHIRVCNRSFERAAALAGAIGGDAVQWDALADELIQADVVVTSTASRAFVVTHSAVRQAMKERKGRSLFFVDIAVPRNVEPSVHQIDNVYVYNIDDLEQEVAVGLHARQAEADAAEKIVAAELADFEAWRRSLAVTPAIVALRTRTLDILSAELERTFSTHLKHLGEADRATLRALMDSAAAKLLHSPVTRLRERASSPDGAELVRAVTDVFDLPEPSGVPPPPRADPEAGADDAPVSATKRLRLDAAAKADEDDGVGRGR
jgi:glutamyl-tRNA reductase